MDQYSQIEGKIVVLGASPNPIRYSYTAVRSLLKKGFEVIPVGIKEGEIEGLPILIGQPFIENVHTISLYVGIGNQPPLYDYILSLYPQRIIFNPGAENFELVRIAEKHGIDTEMSCTLVLIATDQF